MEYWDGIAGEKVFTHPLDLNFFLSLVPVDAAVLDYGCGYGRILDQLFQAGFQNAVGVDFSVEMVARGRRTHPRLDLRVQTGRDLDFADGSFDAALLFAVLNCIPEGGDQLHLVRDLFRVLRPGGVLYVSDYLLQTDARNLARYAEFRDEFGLYGVFGNAEGAVFRHHSLSWIKSLLSPFHQVEFRSIPLATMNGNRAEGFQYFGIRP